MTQKLAVHQTAIPGLLIIDLPVPADNRGWFKENWQRQKMLALGLPDFNPVQNNISFNSKVGSTRGIHAEPWDKYISVASGRIFAAWVDLRKGPSLGKTVSLELGPERAVFVPRGVGNSYQTLQENTAYTYLVNDHWSASSQENYSFLNLADQHAAIDWPIPLDQAELSDKDQKHPFWPDIVPIDPAPLLVVGAEGQLGKELVRQLSQQHIPYIACGRAEIDLAKPQDWLEAYRWSSLAGIINAGAYTAVDRAESSQGRSQAWAVNAKGPAALAALAQQAGIPLVQVSTDYVFDGSLPLGHYYTEQDNLAPLSVYGQSKAAGELGVSSLSKHYIVRTSWVIGAGKNFVATMSQLAQKSAEPAVVADQFGRPTFTEDLAAGILHLLKSKAPYGTYHLTNSGDIISWAQLAQAVFTAHGLSPDKVKATSTAAYFAKTTVFAPRPKNSALDLTKIMATGFTPRDHRQALAAYLGVALPES